MLSKKLSFIKPFLRKCGLFKDFFAESDSYYKILDEGYLKNVASTEEMNELYTRLKPVVYGEKI